jgi:hypothetical protein
MQIKKIHSMKWTEDKSYVVLIADTGTGDSEEIATPYNETSIIWADVQAFPVDQIQPFQPEI